MAKVDPSIQQAIDERRRIKQSQSAETIDKSFDKPIISNTDTITSIDQALALIIVKRKAKGINQQAMAEHLKISRQYYNKIELGKAPLDLMYMLAICSRVDVRLTFSSDST